jgi:hypothetical protein
MNNAYRLSSNAFDRKEPHEDPKRVIWLSVEGTKTEIKYFTFLERYKSEIGINPIIKIEPLRRTDTKADPMSVLHLLDEYVRLKDESLINQIAGLPNLVQSVGLSKIKVYLEE